ncbi:hypothetical protein Ddc_21362 [Ditylenchus destructor]|nr:hypothetical protein Ddc_21362 [Ditylenchus destructor]
MLNNPEVDNPNYDPEAKEYYYHEIPEHYTWNPSTRIWTKRKGNPKVIGRMYNMTPKQGELFYLRMLLLHVKGAKDWIDLRTFEGEVHSSYQKCCEARGLLQENEEWFKYFEEAKTFKMPAALRQLFVTALHHCGINNADKIWDQFKEDMCEDFWKKQKYSKEDAIELAKWDIEEQLKICGTSLKYFGIALPKSVDTEKREWNKEEESKEYVSLRKTMNDAQNKIVMRNNVYRLKENKRVANSQQEFAYFILDMGNGNIPIDENEYVEIPEKYITKTDLVDDVLCPFIDNGLHGSPTFCFAVGWFGLTTL